MCDKLPMFVLNMSLRIQEVKDDEVKKILSKMSDVLCREVGMS